MLQSFREKRPSRGKKGIALLLVYLLIKWILLLSLGSWLNAKPWWKPVYFLFIPALAIPAFVLFRYRQTGLKNKTASDLLRRRSEN